jgi:GR25 family glycosyltransferase involved in LPS biosynthesis
MTFTSVNIFIYFKDNNIYNIFLSKCVYTVLISICLVLLPILLKYIRDQSILSRKPIKIEPTAALVIHLDRASQRRDNVQSIFATLDQITETKAIEQKTIKAIDGQNLSPTEQKKYYQGKLFKPLISDQYVMSKNAIACFLSHRKAWQYIVEQQLNSALIFEDDACINKELFARALKKASLQLRDNLIIRFKNRDPHPCEHFTGIYKKIYIPLIAPHGLVAYMVSQASAQQLLNLSEKIDRPVDDFLRLIKITQIYSGEIYPSGIDHIDEKLGGSTIGYPQDTKIQLHFFQKILREARRIYQQVKMIYQFHF